MASGDDQHARPTRRFDREQLAALTQPAAPEPAAPIDEVSEAFREWNQNVLAAGTLPHDTMPLASRTETVDDPMTTGLLAEASRATQTVELSPEEIAAAHLASPEVPAPAPASPRLIRRPTRLLR